MIPHRRSRSRRRTRSGSSRSCAGSGSWPTRACWRTDAPAGSSIWSATA
jgi:hypothetical protein